MTPGGDWAEVRESTAGFGWRRLVRPGRPGAVPLVCVHGIGPGTTGEINFAPLVAALPGTWPIHLIDLIGFGGSPPKPGPPGFDVALWLGQIETALDRAGAPAVLVGNSVGGALALRAAARRQDLLGVVAIGAPASGAEPTPELRRFWRAPRDRAELAAAMIPMSFAGAPPAAAAVEQRWAPFASADYAQWFDAALADPGACLAAAAATADEAARITAPIRILHGLCDRACPPGPLAAFVLDHLPAADLSLLGRCGHNVIAERTGEVLAALRALTPGEP